MPTPVHDYARRVASGEVVAGPAVRGECNRFLADIRDGHKRGLTFDAEAATRAMEFFPEILTVEVDDEPVPFELLDWQAFVIGSLFGWYIYSPTRGEYVRRFQTAYIETGKGSGKSPLAAGVGLYCMVADGVASAQVYAAATIRKQAMILFKDATDMVERSPELKSRLVPSGKNPIWQWTHPGSRSIFTPLSKDEAVSGPRPNCALVDEYHEHKNSDALDMLEAGFKHRVNPLLFVITNSGSEKASPCGILHDTALSYSMGTHDEADQGTADRFFAFVTCLDEGDDPLKDETCWPKANPSLGHTIGYDYLRKQVNTAKSMPSRQNKILRLNFCEWTDAPEAWLSREAWERCESEIDFRELHKGDSAFVGLDMSYTTDPSAKATVWPYNDDKGQWCVDAVVDFWRPEVGLQAAVDKDRVRYDVWAKQGHLQLSPGAVIKLAPIALAMDKDAKDYSLQSVAYDRYRLKELRDEMEELGVVLPMIEHPQGFRRMKLYDGTGAVVIDEDTGRPADNPLWMPQSCQELENMVIEGRLRVQVNPMLRWNIGGCVIRPDPAGTGNFILSKNKSTTRIDGAVALAMAIGAAKANQAAPTIPSSPWETEGFSLVQ